MSQQNAKSKQPLIRYVNRQQMSWRAVDVEKLIGEDHRARAIWALVGRLDLRLKGGEMFEYQLIKPLMRCNHCGNMWRVR